MVENKLDELFNKIGISEEALAKLASETEFIKRNRLISAHDMLHAICAESSNGTVSYNDIAAQIESSKGISVSKQAIWKKVTDPCLAFFQGVLELVIMNRLDKIYVDTIRTECRYKRILVQDSTIIKLPIKLFGDFSGVANQSTKVCNARIQGVYDIINECFVSFSIEPYTKNDLKSAPELLLREGDLSLRDRGYLIYDEIQRHINKGADCIYRYKFGMMALDPISEQPIDIPEKLRKEPIIDMEIRLNNKEKTLVRITAAPIDEKTANTRRMKAKQEKKLPLPKNTYSCSLGLYSLRPYQKAKPAMSCCSEHTL